MENKHVYLKENEFRVIALAITALLSDLNEPAVKEVPWTPEARKYHKDMKEAANSVKIKFEKLGVDMSDFPEYKPGDEEEFLTKES